MIFAPASSRKPAVSEPTPDDIAANYRTIRLRIDEAARRAGRDPAAVRLVAVSKTKPAWMVEAAHAAGARIFGENYVQEALAKIEALSPLTPPIEWHLIGALQTNKAKFVPGNFALVHAVDSEKLAREIDRRAGTAGVHRVDVLIEVNLGGEETKAGIPPDSVEPLVAALRDLARVRVRGLMAMPPLSEGEENRPHFVRLRRLAQVLAGKDLLPKEFELSMGTTSDFEVAVEEGATLVRVGTAIFGPRARKEQEASGG